MKIKRVIVNAQPTTHIQPIEALVVCDGYADFLDVTLKANLSHFDNYIVVTSHKDQDTHKVCAKYNVACIRSDAASRLGNTETFDKTALQRVGSFAFLYEGWRCFLDPDIMLPEHFRRILFEHGCLQEQKLYGAERIDVVGEDNIRQLLDARYNQNWFGCYVLDGLAPGNYPIPHRYVENDVGYIPGGYFQLWHRNGEFGKQLIRSRKMGGNDFLWAAQWPEEDRMLLPTVTCYHLLAQKTVKGENWKGRKHPKLSL